jgi:hypothetical protein
MTQDPSSVRVLTAWGVRQEVFQEQDIPSRTRLYRLEPQALGTVWQESLTSYLNRLGWRHHISPRVLVLQELVPRLSGERPHRQWATFCREGGVMNINGTGALATEWALLLEQLTGRSDLHFLTLLWWIGNFSARGHLRKTPAWCAACYAEWCQRDLPIYQPLLWMLRVVTVCPQHQRRLEDHCPHCQKHQSAIALETRPGHCTQCNTWLGSPLETVATDEKTLHWQAWVIRALEELSAASRASGELSWEPFFSSLAICMKEWGACSRLTELTGLDRTTFYLWLGRMRRAASYAPTLEALLSFCYACDLTPLQLMTTPDALLHVIRNGAPAWEPRPRRSKRPLDRERALKLIQAVLTGSEELMGVMQIARRLGCHASLLWQYFPQECSLISQRYEEYQNQCRKEREMQVCEEVRLAVLTLHTQNIFPSHHKVSALLSDPNLMRMPEARSTWHAVRRELGLEQ